jgi:hypothetical protein
LDFKLLMGADECGWIISLSVALINCYYSCLTARIPQFFSDEPQRRASALGGSADLKQLACKGHEEEKK